LLAHVAALLPLAVFVCDYALIWEDIAEKRFGWLALALFGACC
jgi:hypothetical protein